MPDSDHASAISEVGAEEPVAPAPQLAARAVGSGVWSLVGQIYQVILGVISFGLLTRWLVPSDYGILGMAATVSGFLGVIGDSGITNAVMRLPQIDAAAESTAFWLSLMGGAVLAVFSGIAAPILAWFYKNHAITWVSVALASTFLLAVPMRVPTAKLSRELRFRELTLINIVASTIAAALTVVLAMRGLGVWALVAQGVAVFVLQSAMTTAVCRFKISPRLWSRARARELAHVGSRLSGFSLAVTVGRALDSVLAGRFLGSAALGFMGMGMKLVHLPVERLSGAMYSVFLPATIELRDDGRQGRAFKSAARLALIIIGPFALGTLAISPEIVALLPPRWHGLEPVLRLYALTTLVTPVGYLAMSVLVAHGRTDALLRTSIALIPVSWAAAIVGASSGSVLGMVAAWSFSVVSGTVVFVCLIRRRLALGRDFWAAVLTPVAMSALMALGVRLSLALLGLRGTRLGFIVGAVIGTVLYGAFAWLTMRTDLIRVTQLLKESLRRRTGKRSK
jgi:O-antigen/teichoic acid export membrane protein